MGLLCRGMLKGICAVVPKEGAVYASFSGRAIATDGKAHAISMVSDTGVEVIIYVGMDTVELNGKYYEALGVFHEDSLMELSIEDKTAGTCACHPGRYD